jgi:hypothetical protein
MRARELKRLVITGCEQQRFTGIPAVPNWPDGVNHPFRGQPETWCHFGLTGWTTRKGAATGQKLRAGSLVDGTVHTATTEQTFIGSVYNRIHGKRRDVSL